MTRFHLKLPTSRTEPGITAYLLERLGNQLFIYGAALAQARRLSVPCYANLAFFRQARPRRQYSKHYGLSGFDNGLKVPSDPHAHRPLLLPYPAHRSARLLHGAIGPHNPAGRSVFTEHDLQYDCRIDQVRPGTTLFGFFQSWRYLTTVSDELRHRITTLTNPSSWYNQLSTQLRPNQGHIVLNLRRGDYLHPTHNSVHGVIGPTYYRQALSILRRLGYDGNIYVASDSLDIAMAELAGLPGLLPINPPSHTDPIEVLVLLSRADAFVAANSTFSWWAAYLGEQRGRTVIAPRPWYAVPTLPTHDLLPPTWLTLGDPGLIVNSDACDLSTWVVDPDRRQAPPIV